jgi:Bax inhibitor 1
MSTMFSGGRQMPSLNTLLAMSPVSSKTAKHLTSVYRTLATCLLASALGACVTLYLNVAIPPVLALLVLLGLLFNFVLRAPLSAGRASALHAYCLAQGVATAPLLRAASLLAYPALPAVAFGATATIFAGFSVSALCARRRSYLLLGGIASAGLTSLLWIGVLNMFMKSDMLFSLQLYGGLMAFSMFVLYDTQLIVEKAERGSKDYVQDAFLLFVDFVALFQRILIIMMRNNQRKDDDDENNNRRRRR